MKFKTSFLTACLVCTKARRTPFPVREYSLINKKAFMSERIIVVVHTISIQRRTVFAC